MRDYFLKPSPSARSGGIPATAAASPAIHPAPYPDTRAQSISSEEIKRLAMASVLAWEKYAEEIAAEGSSVQAMSRELKMSLKDMQDEWRHTHVKAATAGRATGLRGLKREDYNTVLGHFLNLAGLTEAAFRQFIKAEPTNHGDTGANAAQSARAVDGILRKMEAHFATQVKEKEPDAPASRIREAAAHRVAAYLRTIEERKYAGQSWVSLSAKEQWQLYWTLKNRLADMTGAENPERRNKLQRRTGTARRTAAQPSLPLSPSTAPAREKIYTVNMDIERGGLPS